LEIIAQLLSNTYGHLLKKGIGYQGLIYREAVGNLNYFSKSITKKNIFCGVQCLNASEEKIIQHLIAADQAKIYWDSDLSKRPLS
jgi:hypothetical protein